MAQSDDLRIFEGTGMNTDDAYELVGKDYILAVNLRNTGSEAQQLGYETNIEGLVEITESLLPGINGIIGGQKFDDTGDIYAFRFNSAGNNQLIRYNANSKTLQVGFTDITDSAGQSLLPLNPQNYVRCILINKTYLIWWAKDLEVGYTNVNTLFSGGYGTVLQEDLSLLKPQCLIPPTGTYGNDAGQPANYWYGRLPVFTVQYVNDDFNYATWSTHSARIVPYQENTPTTGSNVGQNNYIIIAVNAGSIRASVINIARQVNAETVFSIIKSVNRSYVITLPETMVDVSTEVYEAYDPATNTYYYASYGNEIPIPVDPDETDLFVDYIFPSNAGGLLNGNIAALADWKTLYPRPATSVTVTAIGYNPNIAIPVGTYTDPLRTDGQFNGASGSGAGDHKRIMSVTIAGTPHTGDNVEIVEADIRNAQNTFVVNYPVPPSQDGDLGAVVKSISETLDSASYVLNGDGSYTITFIGAPYFGLQTYAIQLFFAGAMVANSIPCFLDNAPYQLSLEYLDNFGRPFPLETDNTFIVNLPSYAQVNGQAIKVIVQINTAAAPVSAVRYQVLITKPPVIKVLDVLGCVLTYKGVWDAHTNSPSLSVNSGTIGDTYQITTPDYPANTASYTNLGTGQDYNTGDYITNVGGNSGGAQLGQYYAVLPRTFGNLVGNEILALSLNPLNLFNSDYSQDGIDTILGYDYAVGDRCTLHYFIPLTGGVSGFDITPGSGYTDGTYVGAALSGGTGTGAIATVTVAGGKVTTVTITSPGTGYTNGDDLTGSVPGGTGWKITITQLAPIYFNDPCINLAVLGYDPNTFIVKMEKSSALIYSGSHIYYNGQQIDNTNIFFRLYSPQQQAQTVSTTQNSLEWFETGESYTITNGIHDTTEITLFDGGAYYKTRQYADALLPFADPPHETLSTDFNYSDFYPSAYSSFGRPRTYYDVLEPTEQQASLITSQNYILGSRINGLNRFYPADIYGENNGQTSSSKGAIQILWQRGTQLIIIQEQDVFYVPVNEAYTVLNDEISGQSISEKLLNNGRYATEGVGIGLAKESFWFGYDETQRVIRAGFIDPNKSLPFELTMGGIVDISGKMSKYFKSTLQPAYALGKKLFQFWNEYYQEVYTCIQASGAILVFFPFDAEWQNNNTYDIAGTDVTATPNGAHCTASYNSSTGIVTYTPASDYIGNDTATFTFMVGGNPITVNNCLQWTAGSDAVASFSFLALFNVPLSSEQDSNTILASGNTIAAAISITDGQYNINGGSFTASPGTVNNGDIVQVKQTSSGSNSTLTTATLTIDGQSAGFDVTTTDAGTSTDLTPSGSYDPIGFEYSLIFTLGTTCTDNCDISYDFQYIQGGNTYTAVTGGTTTITSGSTVSPNNPILIADHGGTVTDVIITFTPSPNPNDTTLITYTSPITLPI